VIFKIENIYQILSRALILASRSSISPPCGCTTGASLIFWFYGSTGVPTPGIGGLIGIYGMLFGYTGNPIGTSGCTTGGKGWYPCTGGCIGCIGGSRTVVVVVVVTVVSTFPPGGPPGGKFGGMLLSHPGP